MLNFGKYKGRLISSMTSREEMEYLYWLRQSVMWSRLAAQTKEEIVKMVKY